MFDYRIVLCAATVTEATEGAATSGDDGEEDFLEVVGPEVPSESGKPEGFVEKIKRWCSWVYYYIAVSLDRVIDLLNEVSKDYREIADQLKKERKEKRIEKLRRAKFGYWGSRARGEESSDPEMETKVLYSILALGYLISIYPNGILLHIFNNSFRRIAMGSLKWILLKERNRNCSFLKSAVL